MITRTHTDGCTRSVATYSDCERYRYTLTRVWGDDTSRILFLMLNPSTADEVQNDPTVERCERRARALGYGSFRVCNIFAFRATDPKVMRAVPDPIGPDNDDAIQKSCLWSDGAVICAWGTHGEHMGRGVEVAALLKYHAKHPMVLDLTKAGHPKHPLYIGYDKQPIPWSIP